jgi:hypothetical protein
VTLVECAPARSFRLKGLDRALTRHIDFECGFFVEAVEQVALVAFDYRRSTIGVHYSDLLSVVDGARGSTHEDAEWAEPGLGR